MQDSGTAGRIAENPETATPADEATVAFRRDALARWRDARAGGLTAGQAAAAVGVPKSTLYRWVKRLRPGSRRPHNPRKPQWSPDLVDAIRRIRAGQPGLGKVRIAQILAREGHETSEATVGRILRRLVESNRARPVVLGKRDPSGPSR